MTTNPTGDATFEYRGWLVKFRQAEPYQWSARHIGLPQTLLCVTAEKLRRRIDETLAGVNEANERFAS